VTRPTARVRIGLVLVALLSSAQSPAPSASVPSIDGSTLLRDLQTLSADAMQGREPGTSGHERARRFIVRRFKESGLETVGRNSYEHPFTFSDQSGQSARGTNIVGQLRGSSGASLAVVITAHYDHLGVRNGKVFNGADDNASGTAALFAIAAHFAANRPDHTLVFAATDAEETGIHGGRALASDPPVPLAGIVMNVNLDMIGRDSTNVLYVVGTAHYPALKRYVEPVRARAPIKLVYGHDSPGAPFGGDWTRESDHYAFHQRGVPFVYFGVEDFEQHHRDTDDFDTIARDFYVNAVRTVTAAVREFDRHAAEIAKSAREERR
jgi:Zn-dependent M28 family amino/carboxypeptidase